jgi:hypothetical protein
MSYPNHHRIQRQVVELGLAAAMPAAEAQERLAREMRDSVNPRIAAIFDAAAGPHELLRLDRLEIDVGTIGGGDWTSQFRERFVERLEQALTRYRPATIAELDGSGTGTMGAPSSRDPFSRPDATDAANRSAASGSQAQLTRLLLFYMEHGRLPWWGTRPERGFAAAFEAAQVEPDWRALRPLAQRDRAARARLIDVLGESLLESAVARWSGLPHAALACVALAPAGGAHAVARAWRRGFWVALLDWIFRDGLHGGRERELVGTLHAVRVAAGAARVAAGNAESGANKPSSAEDTARPYRDLPSPWREWLEGAAQGDAPEETPDSRPNAQREPPATPPARLEDAARRAQPAAAAAAEAEAIYLPCAGVLLVHPFLESLFRERGLLEGRAFRDAAARSRAVRLVGALGFGLAEMPEYDLLIAKLLCGHALAEPLEPVALEEADMTACDQLLAALLEHWQALRSSSAQWLRGQFFLRDGKLEEVESGFRLTVERRAQDVLLARLPWGVGVIRLPWMEQKVFVHWLD